MATPVSARERIREFRTAIFASALSAGLILLILLLGDIRDLSLKQRLESILCAFPAGVLGANVYIRLAARVSILGRVTRTNAAATLKALLIVLPLGTVLSLVSIAAGVPPGAQVWIFLEVAISCIFSDVAYVRARRIYE